MQDDPDIRELQGDIKSLLAAALQSDQEHVADIRRRDELHVDEIDRRDDLHVREIDRRNVLHAEEQAHLVQALETRDVIGQAKGVIMSSLGCTADGAYALLVKQSQHENRKVYDIAVDITKRTYRAAPKVG
ncbi:MAG TPA: ANTAR domain-containing protein [Ilumatobacteraceae bacterium]